MYKKMYKKMYKNNGETETKQSDRSQDYGLKAHGIPFLRRSVSWAEFAKIQFGKIHLKHLHRQAKRRLSSLL